VGGKRQNGLGGGCILICTKSRGKPDRREKKGKGWVKGELESDDVGGEIRSWYGEVEQQLEVTTTLKRGGGATGKRKRGRGGGIKKALSLWLWGRGIHLARGRRRNTRDKRRRSKRTVLLPKRRLSGRSYLLTVQNLPITCGPDKGQRWGKGEKRDNILNAIHYSVRRPSVRRKRAEGKTQGAQGDDALVSLRAQGRVATKNGALTFRK